MSTLSSQNLAPSNLSASNATNNSTSSTNASAQLLSMAQQIAQQDIKKMFAGIQKTHFDIFEEAKHWDGKLPVRKPVRRVPPVEDRNATAYSDEEFDDTESNLTEDVEPDARAIQYTEMRPSERRARDKSQQSADRRIIGSRRGAGNVPTRGAPQRDSRIPAEKPSTAVAPRKNTSQNASTTRKQPTKPPTGRLHQRRLEQRTTKNVAVMSQPGAKVTFDESTMMERPVYHDENIQTSPVGAEMEVQQGDSMLDYEQPQKELTRHIDPRKEEMRRRQALQAISPKKVSKRVLQGVAGTDADVPVKSTSHGNRRSPARAGSAQDEGRPSSSRLMHERAKRQRVLKSAPRTRIARAPSPSQLHEKHERMAEAYRQQQEASRWKSRQSVAPLNLPPTQEDTHEDESRRSSFSARMLPREALESTQPNMKLHQPPQKAEVKTNVGSQQAQRATEKQSGRTREAPTRTSPPPKTKVTIIPPQQQQEESFEHQTAVTTDLSNLSDAPSSQHEPVEMAPAPARQDKGLNKHKLFEKLKDSLLKTRVSQIDDSTMIADETRIEEPMINEPFVLEQTDSIQVETIIEKQPKGMVALAVKRAVREKRTERPASPEVHQEPRSFSRREKKPSPREESPKKRSLSPEEPPAKAPTQSKRQTTTTTKRKTSPVHSPPKKKTAKVTFDDVKTPDTAATNQLRLSFLDLQRSLNGVQIEQLFDLMDEHNKEDVEIRKRLIESKRSPSVSLSTSPTNSLRSSQESVQPKKKTKRDKILSQLRESADLRRSSFNVSEFLSPIRSNKDDPKTAFRLTERERAEIFAAKADNNEFWRRTSNAIGEVCSDVEPHVLFEIIADVIQEEVFEKVALEVKKISDEAVQSLFKAEFDASSFEFNDSNLSASVDSSNV